MCEGPFGKIFSLHFDGEAYAGPPRLKSTPTFVVGLSPKFSGSQAVENAVQSSFNLLIREHTFLDRQDRIFL